MADASTTRLRQAINAYLDEHPKAPNQLRSALTSVSKELGSGGPSGPSPGQKEAQAAGGGRQPPVQSDQSPGDQAVQDAGGKPGSMREALKKKMAGRGATAGRY